MTAFGPHRTSEPVPVAGRNRTSIVFALLVGVAIFGHPLAAEAAKIGELSTHSIGEQALRFLTLRDPSVRYALAGSILLGVACGLLGSFLVVRRLALVGDALSHAVLPGVAAGFLWNQTKDPMAIFVGAVVAGLLGTLTVEAIKQTTRLKEDAALGLVLAGFYAVGICLVTMLQRMPSGAKSGIDKFLFGQAAAIGPGDLKLMAAVAALAILTIATAYRPLLVASFDAAFARSIGLPVRRIHYALMMLLAFSVVAALQAVGVVLVSAMLVTPAAAAYLLTDRMHRMLWIAAGIGMGSAALGCFLSFLGSNLPTGPLMVLSGSGVFAAAFLFAPRHGLVTRWWLGRSGTRRIRRENTLKTVYRILEDRRFHGDGVSFRELAERRRATLEDASREARDLVRHGFATLHPADPCLLLTPAGRQRAVELVRNHRLWELYLTHAAHIPADHVHDEAERIEHVLGEDVVRELERRLNYADTDPHGRPIPNAQAIRLAGPQDTTQPPPPGYGS
ncbi:MAG: metal ABC transporter permease [Verrucomicrobiales bacterium]|nr:metal ABC transporter permease [Verrucomicrobiales bacterium]